MNEDDELRYRARIAYQEAGGVVRTDGHRVVLDALAVDARSLLPVVLRAPSILDDALVVPLARPDDPGAQWALFHRATAEIDDPAVLRSVLRRLRHAAVLRIVMREILGLADIDQTSAEMAGLAAAAVDAALAVCRRFQRRELGPLVLAEQEDEEVPLVVLGMGKLGGGELNLGSDIDLCFFYGTDAVAPTGAAADGRSALEVYGPVVTATSKALADVTEDGFVFRVDLRLRPEGSRGPIASSFDAALRYYESWGRTWERAALLRARPVAGDLAFGKELLDALRPFVYRRSVDPTIATEMRELLERGRREMRADPDSDLKLGRGGIREAEFFVQTLQLVWGGKQPELQVTGTVEAARRLVASGHLSDGDAANLEADWALLRRVEHRLHVQAGYQTHALPDQPAAMHRLARSLGFADGPDLDAQLAAARQRVAALFDSLDGPATKPRPVESGPSPATVAMLSDMVADGAQAQELAEEVTALGVRDADASASHLLRLGQRASSPLGPVVRQRHPELGPMLLTEVAHTVDPDQALRYLADFFARLGGSFGMDRLLLEQPRLTRRLIGLFGASATLSSALVGHPESLGELLTANATLRDEDIHDAHEALARAHGAQDAEAFIGELRRLKVLTTVRVGLGWIGGDLELSDVSGLLTTLAEQQLTCALGFAIDEAIDRFGPLTDSGTGSTDAIVVVGLGKLGSRELGFGSDLDLFFLYRAEGATSPPSSGTSLTASELFTRVAQRTLRVLSQPEAAGPGYEVDTRLRPSGSQGMLVVSVDAFERYHESRAQDWERLALSRARVVAGPQHLTRTVDALLGRHAYAGPVGREEIARLRRRIETELAGEGPGRYHPKLGYGALLDVEFAVQVCQVEHADEPSLRVTNTLEALRALTRESALDTRTSETLEQGYHFFRNVEQALRFLDERAEPVVHVGSRTFTQLARRLGIRDRDGRSREEVLRRLWESHATSNRAAFEALVGDVGTRPAWAPSGVVA